VTLTRDSERLRLTVNVQIGLSRPILQGFLKLEDQICELNYKRTKFIIRDKVENQFYNFAYFLLNTVNLRTAQGLFHESRSTLLSGFDFRFSNVD